MYNCRDSTLRRSRRWSGGGKGLNRKGENRNLEEQPSRWRDTARGGAQAAGPVQSAQHAKQATKGERERVKVRPRTEIVIAGPRGSSRSRESGRDLEEI